MKTFKHFSEDIETRRQQLKQRQDDQIKASKDAITRKRERDADKAEMKREIKSELGIDEAYDKDVMGSSQIRKTGQRGEIGRDRRKSEPEKRRMKAAGGGKMVPAKSYKDRKDIGQQRQASTRVQQPEKERGSAALSAKEAQRKAYKERKAREAGAKTQTASQLLTKKKKPTVSPGYKPQKASGYSRDERRKLKRAGDRLVKDIRTGKEKKASHYDPKL